MSSIYDWSTTADNNTNSDSAISWAEGMNTKLVNNSSRAEMARHAEFIADIAGGIEAGGTANGLTVTANSAFTTYADNRIIAFKATADNTGAATLNVNGIGAKAIRKMSSTGDVALGAGDIKAEGIYVCRYSTDANTNAGGWLLQNPTTVGSILGSSTDNTVPRFDGTGGAVQTSGVTIDDSNNVSGIADLTITGQFNSAGIVDVATQAAMRLENDTFIVGRQVPDGGTHTIARGSATHDLHVSGGNDISDGATLVLRGGSNSNYSIAAINLTLSGGSSAAFCDGSGNWTFNGTVTITG